MSPLPSQMLLGALIALVWLLVRHIIHATPTTPADEQQPTWPADFDDRWARIDANNNRRDLFDLIRWEKEADDQSPALRDIEQRVLANWQDMPYDQEADQ